MMQTMKRGVALLVMLVMCISFVPALQIHADAAEVEYRYSGSYVYNWGKRGEAATFLSPMAKAFYTEITRTIACLLMPAARVPRMRRAVRFIKHCKS